MFSFVRDFLSVWRIGCHEKYAAIRYSVTNRQSKTDWHSNSIWTTLWQVLIWFTAESFTWSKNGFRLGPEGPGFSHFIIVVIITWPSEKLHKKIITLTSQLSEPVIRSNGLCLCKISSLMSQFSTNQRTFSLFRCFLFAVFNNCWSTAPSYPFNSFTN